MQRPTPIIEELIIRICCLSKTLTEISLHQKGTFMKKKIILIFTTVMLLILSSTIVIMAYSMKGTISKTLADNQTVIARQTAWGVTEEIRNVWTVLELESKEAVFLKQNEKDKIARLKVIKEGMDFLHAGYIDTEGNLLRYDGQKLNVKGREYFERAVKGEFYISSPELSIVTGELVVFYSVPIKENDKVVGVLVASMAGESLVNLVDTIQIGRTGYALILDSKGNYVSHKDKKLINNRNNAIEDAEGERLVALLKDAISGGYGCGNYAKDGYEKFMSYTPIPETDWTILVTINKSEVYEGVNQIIKNFVVLGVFGLFVTIVAALFVASMIAKPMIRLGGVAEKIAEGDFTVKIDARLLQRKDEIGTLSNTFYNMNQKLSLLLWNVKELLVTVEDATVAIEGSSDDIRSSVEEVSKTIEVVAVEAQDQAKQTEQGVIHINQLAETIKKVHEVIESTSSSSKMMNEEANFGLSLVEKLIKETDELQEYINKVYVGIKETNESSNNIGNASKVISEISEKTNLLALNAAIEAARAGEYGKGFAVVAEEIRELSDQSNGSTNEINLALDELQSNSRMSVEAIEFLFKIVQEQIEIVKKTELKYNNIVEAIRNVVEKTEQVSKESKTIDHMKNAMVELLERLSAVAEENAASTEETLAISQEQRALAASTAQQSNVLVGKVRELKEQVNRFKITENEASL